MKRILKWWKVGLSLLLALIAMQVGASFLARTVRVRAFLTRQLEKSFGRTVDVRNYSVTLFPTPQLDAEGITVGEDPAFGHEYFLRADRLSAGLRWIGLLRGRFELGTLQLDSPSLILTRNAEGRWNLERWLPASASPTGAAIAAVPGAQATPAHHLQKIDISDGRASFKLGDDKASFAFIHVEGSVEQTAAGRWQLDLKAEPWRSGTALQLAGTVRVRGDVAGTSTRLQPAHLQMTWEKSSLADVFRLVGGRDFGVRGAFATEATADSGGALTRGAKDLAPGDWLFSLHARAAAIHRWDLTERDDNPRVGVHVSGRWNPGSGTVFADEVIVESPRSNLRGSASMKSIAGSSFDAHIDSAGIQAADLLDWYRAFRPNVSEGIRAMQSFTGAASFRGWPLVLSEAAFSSSGGSWVVPGFAAPFEVRAVRGGMRKQNLLVEPFAVNLPARTDHGEALVSSADSSRAELANVRAGRANISLTHDFAERTGNIRIEGQISRVEDAFAVASAFGRRIENGWELKGKAAGDLQWVWSAGKLPVWNGHAEVSQATLQLAGLNLPVQMESLRGDWRNATRRFTLGRVEAFGANWTGFVEQTAVPPSEVGEPEIPGWSFQLQADHLDAADLDRWIGPRARPSWLQRLLPAGLGGASGPEQPSAVLRRIRADGELRVDQLTIEKIKLKQFRAQTKVTALQLSLRNVQAQWAGGEVKGAVNATFSAKPHYDISAAFDRVSIAQLPWLGRHSDRLSGAASGSLELHADGIGREVLLSSLAGKGEFGLAKIELRGWDVAGTIAQGDWKTGVSKWSSGVGLFHISDGGFDLNSLRLASPSDEFLLKGSVSFAEDTDLTAESHATGRSARPDGTLRFIQISGPLAGPRVSLEKTTAQQPGD